MTSPTFTRPPCNRVQSGAFRPSDERGHRLEGVRLVCLSRRARSVVKIAKGQDGEGRRMLARDVVPGGELGNLRKRRIAENGSSRIVGRIENQYFVRGEILAAISTMSG